ncbi:hypothetical protein X801_07673, partial [Opisthorchis viverrini]
TTKTTSAKRVIGTLICTFAKRATRLSPLDSFVAILLQEGGVILLVPQHNFSSFHDGGGVTWCTKVKDTKGSVFVKLNKQVCQLEFPNSNY